MGWLPGVIGVCSVGQAAANLTALLREQVGATTFPLGAGTHTGTGMIIYARTGGCNSASDARRGTAGANSPGSPVVECQV